MSSSYPYAPRSVAFARITGATASPRTLRSEASTTSAARADAYGAAIDVPSEYMYPLPGHVDAIISPGAATSTYEPMLEKSALASVDVVAATARTPGNAAG